MRILLLTPMPPQAQAPGAIPVLLHAMVTALAQRHAVTLVTPIGPEPGEQAALAGLAGLGVRAYGAPLMGRTAGERWGRRLRLGSSWLGGQAPWRTCWFWEPGVQRIVDRLLAEEDFDVVQVEDNSMGAYDLRTPVPKLLTEHEVRRPRDLQWRRLLGDRQPGVPGWRQRILGELDWLRWGPYQRRTWQKFDRLQVFTQRDAEAVGQLAPELAPRVNVNPFGVSMPSGVHGPYRALEQEDPNLLFFAGNYTHAPNVDAALWLGQEILPRLRQVRPGARLALAGIYPPPQVQELAGPGIDVLGPVPEIEPWLERAAVIMAPLRIGGGMRMKVLQSMAHGKPVVTTARGAEGLAVAGEQPPLAVAGSAEEIVAATCSLLEDTGRRHALGHAAAGYVARHFSPDAYVRRLEAVYAGLLGPEPPGISISP